VRLLTVHSTFHTCSVRTPNESGLRLHSALCHPEARKGPSKPPGIFPVFHIFILDTTKCPITLLFAYVNNHGAWQLLSPLLRAATPAAGGCCLPLRTSCRF